MFLYGEVVDAGNALLHQALAVEFPQFVSVGPEPVSLGVAPFVFECDGDTIA